MSISQNCIWNKSFEANEAMPVIIYPCPHKKTRFVLSEFVSVYFLTAIFVRDIKKNLYFRGWRSTVTPTFAWQLSHENVVLKLEGPTSFANPWIDFYYGIHNDPCGRVRRNFYNRYVVPIPITDSEPNIDSRKGGNISSGRDLRKSEAIDKRALLPCGFELSVEYTYCQCCCYGRHPTARGRNPLTRARRLYSATPVSADNRKVSQPESEEAAGERRSRAESKPCWWANLIMHLQSLAVFTACTTAGRTQSTGFARAAA